MGNGQSNQQEPDKVETTQLSAKEEDEKETYKDVCKDQTMKFNRDEVDILLRSLLSAIHIDRQSQRIRFVSREAVIEVLHRIDAWLSLLEDIQEDQVDLVSAHLLAMKSVILACSKHYYDSLSSESEILISLYQSALLSFCSAIEKYGQFRENGKAIYTAEMHKLNVPRSIVDFRNDLLHGSRVKANETDLVYQAVKAVRWLFTYFWPNLTVKQDEKEQTCLVYRMHFPRAQIFHEEINVEVDFSELSGICGEREEDGENSSDFGNGLSYVSRASSRAVSEEDTEIEEFGVPIRLDNP